MISDVRMISQAFYGVLAALSIVMGMVDIVARDLTGRDYPLSLLQRGVVMLQKKLSAGSKKAGRDMDGNNSTPAAENAGGGTASSSRISDMSKPLDQVPAGDIVEAAAASSGVTSGKRIFGSYDSVLHYQGRRKSNHLSGTTIATRQWVPHAAAAATRQQQQQQHATKALSSLSSTEAAAAAGPASIFFL